MTRRLLSISTRKLPLAVDSNNWIFLAGYFAGDPNDEITVHRIADRGEEHRVKIHSTNVLERLSGEIKRRANVVGIFLNERLCADWSARS